jgi:hypothetical protein
MHFSNKSVVGHRRTTPSGKTARSSSSPSRSRRGAWRASWWSARTQPGAWPWGSSCCRARQWPQWPRCFLRTRRTPASRPSTPRCCSAPCQRAPIPWPSAPQVQAPPGVLGACEMLSMSSPPHDRIEPVHKQGTKLYQPSALSSDSVPAQHDRQRKIAGVAGALWAGP